jgi:hypothetical protein
MIQVTLTANEDENGVEGYIHEMQQKLGEAATDSDLLNAVVQAVAKSGIPTPDFVSRSFSLRSAPKGNQ